MTEDLGVLAPLSKPVLHFPTAKNKITGTHMSISTTNRAEKITSNSYLEHEHCSVIKEWHNHSKRAKEPHCSSPATLLITLETMVDIRTAANDIIPVIPPK
jgi:hypothetical protein